MIQIQPSHASKVELGTKRHQMVSKKEHEALVSIREFKPGAELVLKAGKRTIEGSFQLRQTMRFAISGKRVVGSGYDYTATLNGRKLTSQMVERFAINEGFNSKGEFLNRYLDTRLTSKEFVVFVWAEVDYINAEDNTVGVTKLAL